MILLDFNALYFYQALGLSESELTVEVLRNLQMFDMTNYIKRFGQKYGELVVCKDDMKNWRKDSFPQYKQNRKKNRDKEPGKWKKIFEISSILYEEFKKNLPYTFIQVEKCEGDDLIGVLSQLPGKHMIISTDKDFKQLLSKDVKQFTFRTNTFITEEKDYILQHILKGDSSDGVPNIYSEDNFYVQENRPRQKSIKKDLIEKFNLDDLSMFDESVRKNIHRNRLMIDLTMIPEYIRENILKSYNSYQKVSGIHLRKYLFKHQMKNILLN